MMGLFCGLPLVVNILVTASVFKAFAQAGYEAELSVQTKKPLAGDIEDVHNPRSRSAKLRVAVKK
jgi:16S rRNA C1402 N4-methylase RsmH